MPDFPIYLVALVGPTPSGATALQAAAQMLDHFGVGSAERTAAQALDGDPAAVIVAARDGILPAQLAARTPVPVIRVPVAEHENIVGVDLLSGPDAWPPAGQAASFATVAIGEAGARNAALLIISILALKDQRLRAEWETFRREQTNVVLRQPPLT